VDDFYELEKEKEDEPPSFSRIDVATLHSNKKSKEFPLLAKATRMTVEISEGEMLYLPASWFHEVTGSYRLFSWIRAEI
jgi:hypothetical protein